MRKCWAGWSTSWNQYCWEKYQYPQICRWHHPYGRKWRRTKEPLDESEEESEKVGLKLNIQKTKIMASGPITSCQIYGETMTDFIFWGSKIAADGDWTKLKLFTLLFVQLFVTLFSSPILGSVQFSCSVMSNSLWPHGLQHTRPPCPSRTPSLLKLKSIESSDATQPSHPLSFPSPPAFYLSQHQGLFKWVSSSHQVAKVLEFQLQHQSYQWAPRTRLL